MKTFQQITDFIHGPKTLSYGHWRYRLLHWSHNVEPGSNELPKFLYTNYCPLFHYTNLLVLLLPIITLVKGIKTFFRKRSERYHSNKEKMARDMVNKCWAYISSSEYKYISIQDLYYVCMRKTPLVHEFTYDEFVVIIKNARKLYAKQIQATELRKERITQAIEWSRPIGKVIVGIFLMFVILILLGFVGYFCYAYIWPILYYAIANLFGYIATISWMDALYVFGIFSIVFGLTYLTAKYLVNDANLYFTTTEQLKVEEEEVYEEPEYVFYKEPVMWPLIKKALYNVWYYTFGYIGWYLGNKIGLVLLNVAAFIYNFYENVCPPITIVEETAQTKESEDASS